MKETPSTIEILLMRFKGIVLIPFADAVTAAGLEVQTSRNKLSKKTFPIKTVVIGSRRFIHIRELATFIDNLTETQYQSGIQGTVIQEKTRRGRPTKEEKMRKDGRLPPK